MSAPSSPGPTYGSTKSSILRRRVALQLEELEPRLTPALVAAYSFNEGVGNIVLDASDHGHTGTIARGDWTLSGKYGQALSFNGDGGFIRIPDAPDLRLTTGMTLEAWVFPTTITTNWRDVIYKGNDNYFLMASSSNSSRPVSGGIVNGTSVTAVGTSALPVNSWTYLAATFDGSVMRLFVNGAQVAAASHSGSLATSSNPLQIGGDSILGQFFVGRIDEVRVYDQALSTAGIQSDMVTPVNDADSAPPTAPSNLAATTLSAHRTRLTWLTSTDNRGVINYLIERRNPGYRIFVPVGNTTDTAFTDEGLSANSQYSYRVRAVDGAGNLSVYSPIVGAATTGVPDSFESNSGLAALYGTYEISLTGNSGVANPFDTPASVTFTSPTHRTVTVKAFYDGGSTWRARAYVNESGHWTWTSLSSADAGLNNKSGTFTASDIGLPGFLRKNSANLKSWVNERGEPYLYFGMSAQFLFNTNPDLTPDYRAFVNDAVNQGVTAFGFVGLLGAHGNFSPTLPAAGDNDPWILGDQNRFDLTKFQTTDTRTEWILTEHPGLYIQGMFIGTEWQYDNAWMNLPAAVRQKTLDYMLARWAAFPNTIWFISEDQHTAEASTQLFNRSIGTYLTANDPWNHLLSTLPIDQSFAFTTPTDLTWVDYISLQTGFGAPTLGADVLHNYDSIPLHVQLSEDWYEQDDFWHPELTSTADVNFFQRWDYWSWTIAGGSASYGGRWTHSDPYSQTSLLPYVHPVSGTPFLFAQSGLDSLPYLRSYLQTRDIVPSNYVEENSLVTAWARAPGLTWHTNLMHNGTLEYLVYNPNAGQEGFSAHLNPTTTASMTINLTDATGTYSVEWFRPGDGVVQAGANITGGGLRSFTAPWQGYDVVLRLVHLNGQQGAPPDGGGIQTAGSADRFWARVANGLGTAPAPTFVPVNSGRVAPPSSSFRKMIESAVSTSGGRSRYHAGTSRPAPATGTAALRHRVLRGVAYLLGHGVPPGPTSSTLAP